MKKLLLGIALVVFGTVNAQDFGFGAKAGLNVSNVRLSKGEGSDSRISFHIGGLAEIKFSDKLALQPELLFSSQGTKKENKITHFGTSVSNSITTELNYLNLPVMVKYFIMDGLAVEAGPQIGFLLSAKTTTEVSGTGPISVSTGKDIDIKEQTKSVDFGLNFGASYKLDFGLFFGARYNLGLTDLNKKSGDITFKNSVIQISAGYMF